MKRKFNVKKLIDIGKWFVLFIFLSILIYQNIIISKSLNSISGYLPKMTGGIRSGFGSGSSLDDINDTLNDVNESIQDTNSWLDQIYSR